jgi:hypothetical protein
MIEFVTIRSRKFDIIEQFDDNLVVQDLINKRIYSIKVSFLDFVPQEDDTVNDQSNILSMEWFKLVRAIKKDKEKNGKKN